MEDKIALITGGIGDIGTAICQEFIRRGAIVIAADRIDIEKAKSWQAQQKNLGYNIAYVQIDVTDYDNCANNFAKVKTDYVDIQSAC
jgi:acetoacetyl-CoA reductase